MSSKDYYRIKTSFTNNKVMIEHQYEDMDKVHIGNKKKCIVMSVYFDDNLTVLMNAGWNALIPGTSYS